MKKPVTNVSASVRDRLLKRLRSEGRPFDELLQYYAIERFLYRLSLSEHAKDFVLKGALMLQLWDLPLSRATKDIDLLAREASTVDELIAMVRRCLSVAVPDDGLRFDPESVQADPIRVNASYKGIRVVCKGLIGRARFSVQIDVGFGDVVIPGPARISFPSLLGMDEAQLDGYTPETAIAEKFEAMVVLDMANTRMKDRKQIGDLIEHKGLQRDAEKLREKMGADALKAIIRRFQ